MNKKKKGVSLIVLVITIIVIIILATAVILTINNNNPIKKANEAVLKSDLKNYQDALTLYISTKYGESEGLFDVNSLQANATSLSYNTQQAGELGNVTTIFPDLKGSYRGKIEVMDGKLIYASQIEEELLWAKEVGVGISIFSIVEGVLKSTNASLSLIDDSGVLTIPKNVRKIDLGAFSNVANLKKVIIPGTVEEIGSFAFSGNKFLEEVEIKNGVKIIGSNAFKSCERLQKIYMPDSIVRVDDRAFGDCNRLSDVRLSENLTRIEDLVFDGCGSLKNIVLPEKIQILNTLSFSRCTSLTTINLPKSLTTIQGAVFTGCTSLTNVVVHKENTTFAVQDGLLLSQNKTKIELAFGSMISGTSYEIANGITTIAAGSFSSCVNLEKITIPASVTSMSDNTFDYNKINQIVVDPGNPVFSSDADALYTKDQKTLIRYFTNKSSVTIKEGVEKLRDYNFRFCTKLTSVVLPESLKMLEGQVFNGCGLLTTLSIGKNVNYIHPLFLYGTGASTITISADNKYFSFENQILYNYNKTKMIAMLGHRDRVEIPNTVTTIGDFAFHNRNVKEVIIPNSVTTIESSFNYCHYLTKLVIPSSITSLSTSAFAYAYSLARIEIQKTEGSLKGSPFSSPLGDRAIFWLP